MFKVYVDATRLNRKLEAMGARARNPIKPLRKFGGILRDEAIEIWKAQNFPALAESTIEKRTQRGLKSVERKLQRDVRRATGRLVAAKVAKSGLLQRLFRKQTIITTAEESRGLRNRLAVLQEFGRRHTRDLGKRTDLPDLTQKQHQSLTGREMRAVGKALSKPILGNLKGMLLVEVVGKSVRVVERTKTGWSAVHNEGGQVGHGAKEPQRETLKKPDAEKLGLLARMIAEHALEPFKKE